MSSAPSVPSRRARWAAIAVLAVAWIALLVWLVLSSANPVVVNRVQIQRADVIVAGDWHSGSPASITVARSWKLALNGATVRVRPPEEVHPTGRVIVPLSRIASDLYEVTHGEFPIRPPHPGDKRPIEAGFIRPLVYPDTEDVARQIDALLSSHASD